MLDTAAAANRFGYGLRPGQPVAAPLDQFGRYDAKPAAFASVPTRAALAGQLADYLEKIRGARTEARMAGGGKDAEAAGEEAAKDLRRFVGGDAREAYLSLVGARANAALTSPAPFVERMVHFWANHFAISADKLVTIGMGGLLEAEAIRPNVLGKFSEMVLAVERHPAMLLYLDQAQSVGPDSRVGQIAGARAAANGRKIGLNENLAREIMELHTLGVRTGYAQADVTEFARALTGWTVAGLARGPMARLTSGAPAGSFMFVEPLHQPGSRTIMGRRYAEGGEGQARSIILDLAAHPATATHVATKLARHFSGDTPPPALVARLAARFTETGGDLPTLYRTLVEAPELALPGTGKFKSPWDWSISALRAVGTTEVQGQAIAGLMTQLGQPVWRPGSPAGWDDNDASWAGPDALMRRVEAASRIATRVGGAAFDVRQLAAKVLPGGGSPATLAAIARAESPVEGLSMMLVAPEFLRR